MKQSNNHISFCGQGLMIFFFAALFVPASAQVKEILERYAKDYESDITFTRDVTFSVKVDDKFWTVEAVAKTDASPAKVLVREGRPDQPTFFFFTTLTTLVKIDKGEINALTASAKAFETDVAPFDADVMEGYKPAPDFMDVLLKVYFHFWTRGTPEIVPFNLTLSRPTHGAQAVILYYQPGFRSAYVVVKKGQHANENENSRSNHFPSMLVIIKGEGKAIINGKSLVVKAGQTIIIPPGVSHEFLNPDHEEPMEGILLMFGKGA